MHRAKRGDIPLALLLLLAERPRNGYQLMREIEVRSGGTWCPSPGSVYPRLAQLEADGLVCSSVIDGKRVATIAEPGRNYLAGLSGDRRPPWASHRQAADATKQLVAAFEHVVAAVVHVATVGTPGQRRRAAAELKVHLTAVGSILTDAPRSRPPHARHK